MRKSPISIVVTLGIIILSLVICKHIECQAQVQPESSSELVNETKIFLGDESMWNDVQIILKDVHGLWGGRDIFISGSGKTVVQVVENKIEEKLGLVEKRYILSLNDSEVKKLINTFVENDFVTIEIEDRPGVPDEVRVEIILVNAKAKLHKIGKWAIDQNERFDRIYKEILLIENKTENLEPILEGNTIGTLLLRDLIKNEDIAAN